MSPVAWLVVSALFVQSPAQPSLEGIWEGAINGFAGKLTIRIHVRKVAEGRLEVKMDVPEQGAAGIPVPITSFEGGVFKWEIPTIRAQYEGRLKEGGREMEGTFVQVSPQPLTLKKLDKPPAGPQEPKPPFPNLTEDVTFPSAAEGVTMAGTLTMPPAGGGSHAAVVLISGSGPQDRDEQLVGHRLIEENTATQATIFDILAKQPDEAAARRMIEESMEGQPTAAATARASSSPWFRQFAFYDPALALEKVKCPVLAVDGELDLQVLTNQNLPPIEAALKKGGNRDFQIVRLPNLNHLFQTARTGYTTEYGQIEETMAPAALETIANWLRQKAGMEKNQ